MPDLVGVLVGFARALRAAGVAVGTGDAEVYCAAAACVDPADLVDLYWASRCALVTRHADIPVYDEVFRRYFLGGTEPSVSAFPPTAGWRRRSRYRRRSRVRTWPRHRCSGCLRPQWTSRGSARSRPPPATNWPRCAGSCPGCGSCRHVGAPGA